MMIEGKAIQNGIEIQAEFDPYLPDLWIDELRIRQVLIILLDNAIKFSPENSVVKLSLSVQISDINQVVFSIQDQGIGIAEEDYERIFEPFVQVDNELSRSFDGSGLGLTLARQLVEMHGGLLEVESALDKGTTMKVILPESTLKNTAEISSDQDIQDTKPIIGQKAEPFKILLAEDNPGTIELLSSFFSTHNLTLTVAKNGRDAVNFTRKENPDIILLDLHLPKLDGFAVIQKVRKLEAHKNTPILVISALVFEEEIDKCLEIGADAFLKKSRFHCMR